MRERKRRARSHASIYTQIFPRLARRGVLAMTVLLDDSSVCVRRSLAEALCRAQDAPRGVVLALARTAGSSRRGAQYSPVLTDADLVDCVASGEVVAQTAIAPAERAASRQSCAGRDRTLRCGSRAHRQCRDRLPGGTAAPDLCPLRRRRKPA
jgi:uncharacterized protein (DUF2336 family)